MRTIKFRAKNANNEWVYGSLVNNEIENGKGKFLGAFIVTKRQRATDGDVFYEAGMKRVNVESVGQFTGLTDEYDREVYEGDIVMLDGSPEMGVRVVVFYEGSFNIATRKEYDYLQQGSSPYLNDYAHMDCLNTWLNSGLMRVVGNIYDNPELLED